ncbi:NAD(P)/FAD-dependent oxidoreductase [Caldibacillus thermoamylovorans]|uniref:oxidoreductase n=1 Tax=Caldibacillus thermoamylovorans TaxID=35841 RepID=UPI001D07F4EA|nr:FAD-dependent oxidoreductase [Caldibacillus thermoamylovorans]MCB5936723.1 NAD(P)/FAD-dependent oxidoreductase [Bacillus sp. DFI.2.34]MCB7078276.1 NAD(P)/FAD-dependent oxidoreductase [Caldibacillus thermoamylovorans]
MRYQHLFQKGRIGHLRLKNRVVMPGMFTSLAGPNGELTDQQIRYYEERAKGGVGLIITEFTTIDYELGRGGANQLRIDDDRFIPGFYRLANTIHKYGAKIFVQLHHAGRESNSLLTNGKQIVAPSSVTCAAVGEEPRALTTIEVKDLIQKFIRGAYRAKIAGLDGVELHAAHGYLINQFLSPYTNLRHDEYGGSFENRLRFLQEIIQGIKKQCGADFPVTVRLSVDEFEEGGLDVPLSQEISKYIEKIGANGIHASSGNYNTMETVIDSPLFEEGWKVYLAEEIKKVVNIPVITVGNIRHPQFADAILAEEKADFVAIGRGHIADPEWVRKVVEGREDEIRMCISCLHCAYSKGHLSCSINVRAGRELEFHKLPPIVKSKQVVIVGGGPGGMEAARVLTLRGYHVTVLEKKNRLGGQLNLVTDPIYKKKMDRYIHYLCNEMKRLAIDIRLSTEATVELIQSFAPYAVLLATGGVPYKPDIEGVDLPLVCNYRDVKLEKTFLQGKKIVVLGSGMVCHSTSRRLAEAGNKVTLIELYTKTGSRISPATRAKLMSKLKAMGVDVITDHQVKRIVKNGVIITKDPSMEPIDVEAEQVVIAMGVQPYNPLEESLKQVMGNVFVIGDAAGHTSLADATREGFETAYVLESLVSNYPKEFVNI